MAYAFAGCKDRLLLWNDRTSSMFCFCFSQSIVCVCDCKAVIKVCYGALGIIWVKSLALFEAFSFVPNTTKILCITFYGNACKLNFSASEGTKGKLSSNEIWSERALLQDEKQKSWAYKTLVPSNFDSEFVCGLWANSHVFVVLSCPFFLFKKSLANHSGYDDQNLK